MIVRAPRISEPTDTTSTAEIEMLTALRSFADRWPPVPRWRYSSAVGLLLDVGQLYTPQSWPDSALGDPGNCHVESVSWAIARDWAYVEGVAWHEGVPLDHA
ncbi:hypothetical protein [Kitasatospora sp. NPDC058046]|uniref:hypothetical protein n=1 Tax=Kitasatospora sp. NPDC058046 TaxID=3346312 RepID=UPI0036DA7819